MADNGAAHPLLRDVVFSDVSVTFTPHPVTGRLPVLKNADAVKRAVRNLILTNYYERPYEPLFGGNIRAQLFENADDPLLDELLKAQIEDAIISFEPRASVSEINVRVDNDSNSIFITIKFMIVNQRFPVELDVAIERVR
jgi:phage baseplate assembly protein W